jgi:hypothetical protein
MWNDGQMAKVLGCGWGCKGLNFLTCHGFSKLLVGNPKIMMMMTMIMSPLSDSCLEVPYRTNSKTFWPLLVMWAYTQT